ncbi:MAG: phosphate/phosphite/phosphonate ABC transporter substrate-binding protein [Elusimicrobia bacterium]|nr:phosphate/phosphite/phosphonate ABC transporter substrate-binding protein [Elusimicrobiota bacterium]
MSRGKKAAAGDADEFNISSRKPVIIGGPAEREPRTTYRDYIPWLNYIEDKIEVPVEMVFSSNYDDLVNRMQNNEFDIVFLNALQYVLSSKTSAYVIIFSKIFSGHDYYQSGIIAHNDWGVLNLSALKDREISFVSRDSDAGYFMPFLMLRDAGLSSVDYISSFWGNYESVVNEVAEKRSHAGVVYIKPDGTNIAYQVLADDHNKLKQISTLAVSARMPTPVIAFSKRFMDENPETAEKFKDAVLNIRSDNAGAKAMKTLTDAGWEESYVPAKKEAYDEFSLLVWKQKELEK